MKKFLLMIRKCKKGFTLMECVCAVAIVGLISAMILPLTSGAIKSLRTSDSLRSTAAAATAQNATVKTSKDNKNQKTLYVTVSFDIGAGIQAESAFVFTESSSKDSDNGVQVTYYDLKYGKETEDAK